MSFVIDRFEGEIAVAVLSSGKRYNINKALLPDCAKEGDVINITVSKQETENRKQEAKSLLDSLFDKTEE